MDRYRLIASIIVLFVYLLAMYPIQTIVTSAAILIAYFVLSRIGQGRLGSFSTRNNGKEVRRRNALKNARIYLAPYSSIWGNLKLSNKYCTLRLGSNGIRITAYEKTAPNRSFRIINSKVHSYSDLWDMFCMSFDHLTTFDSLIQQCNTFNAEIAIDNKTESTQTTNLIQNTNTGVSINETTMPEKIDINNASEVEITALPGISIVMAKKLIKKREDINGFKNIDDIFIFLRLKPHMEKQLRKLICINKIKGSNKIKRYNERSIDL